MIQRIQSVFLFLASASFTSFTLLPPSKIGMPDFNQSIPAIVTIVAAALALLSIFLFKNRAQQRKLVIAVILIALIAFVPLLLFFDWYVLIVVFPVWLLPIGIVFAALAARFIKKDEKLIKSLDRLR